VSAYARTEGQLVEQPVIGLVAELGWPHHRTRDLLPLPGLLSGQVALASARHTKHNAESKR
jgi:hypothetical protein